MDRPESWKREEEITLKRLVSNYSWKTVQIPNHYSKEELAKHGTGLYQIWRSQRRT